MKLVYFRIAKVYEQLLSKYMKWKNNTLVLFRPSERSELTSIHRRVAPFIMTPTSVDVIDADEDNQNNPSRLIWLGLS